MVEIVYMSNRGDSPVSATLEQAVEIIKKEQAEGKMVVNLDDGKMLPMLENPNISESERDTVERATMGQLTKNSKLGIINPVSGG